LFGLFFETQRHKGHKGAQREDFDHKGRNNTEGHKWKRCSRYYTCDKNGYINYKRHKTNVAVTVVLKLKRRTMKGTGPPFLNFLFLRKRK
jgi:hypothetical protein